MSLAETPKATMVEAMRAAVAEVGWTDRWREVPNRAYTNSDASSV